VNEARGKLDGYKSSADSTLRDVGNTTQRKYDEAKNATEQTVDEAKSAGSSWFGWGQNKAEEAKQEAASNVKTGVENLKQ
jgi:hypothetical protein